MRPDRRPGRLAGVELDVLLDQLDAAGQRVVATVAALDDEALSAQLKASG